MRILGLSGRRGAGKDTLAAFLIRNAPAIFPGVHLRRVGLADPIKEVLIHAFDAERKDAYGDDAAKEKQLPRGAPGLTIRDGAKHIGTCFAQIEPMHFVRRMMEMAEIVARHHDPCIIVVPDVRMVKEVEAIRRAEGKVVRLLRDPVGDQHPTERDLDSYQGFDLTVDNRTGTVAEAEAELILSLRTWGWTKWGG